MRCVGDGRRCGAVRARGALGANESSSAEDQRAWSTGVASNPAPFHARKDDTARIAGSLPLLVQRMQKHGAAPLPASR